MTIQYTLTAGPEADAATSLDPDGVDRLHAGRQGLSIMLVEDDEADAYLIKRVLKDNPRINQVVHARDGVEALEFLEERAVAPDLAIIDLQMPRKDGFSLLLDLKTRLETDFPAIVLTSSRAGADAYRSWKRGANRVITKPRTVEKLAHALNGVIAAI